MYGDELLHFLDGLNLVHPTELGVPLVEHIFRQLGENEQSVGVPNPDDGESDKHNTSLLCELRGAIERASSLDDAIQTIRQCPYFRPYLSSLPVMIEQIRNRIPADSTIVYRTPAEKFWLESMFSASLIDPIGPVVTDERLVPAALEREDVHRLQRRSFDLHELATASQMAEAHTYRVIFDDLSVSWHAVVLHRDRHFTWVCFFWYRLANERDPADSIRVMRAGIEWIAQALAQKFQRENITTGHGYEDRDSLRRGLLVFWPGFRELYRQNYAAEAMIQGLVGPDQIAPLRAAIYARIALEYQRRLEKGDELSWRVGPCFHPTTLSHRQALCVTVRTYAATEVNHYAGQHEVQLEELHMPHLPRPPRWWELPALERDKLGAALKELGKRAREAPSYTPPPSEEQFYTHLAGQVSDSGFYMKALSGIARPVWAVDLIGDRIHRYPSVPAGEVGRGDYTRDKLKEDRVWAITYYTSKIVGIIQFI